MKKALLALILALALTPTLSFAASDNISESTATASQNIAVVQPVDEVIDQNNLDEQVDNLGVGENENDAEIENNDYQKSEQRDFEERDGDARENENSDEQELFLTLVGISGGFAGLILGGLGVFFYQRKKQGK
ncbi:MAG: hypothetical protein V2A63_04695 [Patescibacteria group bacterium]